MKQPLISVHQFVAVTGEVSISFVPLTHSSSEHPIPIYFSIVTTELQYL